MTAELIASTREPTAPLGAYRDRAPSMPLRHYVQLIRFKVSTQLRSEGERTYIGFLWWLIDPIISMAVYYLVFELLFKRGGPGYVPFLFVGILTFRWLSTAVVHGGASIQQETSLMQQVYLPKIVFPIVTTLVDTVKFAFAFALLLVFLALNGYPVGLPWLGLPLLLGVQLLLNLGVSCLVAGIVPFMPDLNMIVGQLVRILFYLSGVFYEISSIPVQYQFYLRLNPIASLVEAYRGILLHNRWPHWEWIAGIAVVSLVLLLLGSSIIRRYDRQYPKLT